MPAARPGQLCVTSEAQTARCLAADKQSCFSSRLPAPGQPVRLCSTSRSVTLDVLCVPAAVTGLKPAYDDLEPSNSCCGISLPGYDGEEDRPLERPFIVARCACSKAAAVSLVDILDIGGPLVGRAQRGVMCASVKRGPLPCCAGCGGRCRAPRRCGRRRRAGSRPHSGLMVRSHACC